MTEQSTLADIARTFTQAWTSHDMDTAAGYVTDDVTFDGPLAGHVSGKQVYLDGLASFARTVTSLTILAAFGDDAQALIMYNVATAAFGTLTCAELLTFRGGKIAADRLVFDTYPIRGSAGAGHPHAPAE